jgi:hypothetical protein
MFTPFKLQLFNGLNQAGITIANIQGNPQGVDCGYLPQFIGL